MPAKPKASQAHSRIIVGLPNLQDQLRMVDRHAGKAPEVELERWEGLRTLLSELYTQLQYQKQVRVYRLGHRSQSKTS
ncbi:MAG: hypothetical protein HY924_06595 [Elusimicrobia bacterium]|nr:hypothetical protein [Elusimicrobiota bacterium]